MVEEALALVSELSVYHMCFLGERIAQEQGQLSSEEETGSEESSDEEETTL